MLPTTATRPSRGTSVRPAGKRRALGSAIDLAPEESAGQWVSLAWVLGERGETAAAQKAYVTARTISTIPTITATATMK